MATIPSLPFTGTQLHTALTDLNLGSAEVWVNFNGTGTVAIRDSLNVSSITDNGVGQYTVNFTNDLDGTDYCAIANGNLNTGATSYWTTAQAAGSADCESYRTDTTSYSDSSVFNFMALGTLA